MISPGGIPQIPGDMDALARHAESLSGLGGSFASTGERVNTTWQQLAPVYDAPEVGQLLAATGPVQTTAASVGEDISAVGAALATYAETVREIKAQLESLRSQAQAFVDENGGSDDWESDDGKVDRNNQLIGAVNTQVAAFFEAQRSCANTINALYGGPQYRADDGDGQVSEGEYGYTAEQLGAAAGEDGALPWGSTQEHDRGFLGDVGSFFGGAWEGAKNALGDLGALIGRDPVTGEWSWSTAGNAWKGVGTFALALSPPLLIANAFTDLPGLPKGTLHNTLLNAGKGIIAYDEWGRGDNSRAAGMASFNVVSAIVGTKGAGAALRGGGAAAQASRIGAVSRAGTAMIRGGEFLGRLPTTESLALQARQALPSLRLPDFGSLTHIDVPHHVDAPHHEGAPHIDAPSVDGPRGDTSTSSVDTPRPGSVGGNLSNSPSHQVPNVDTPSTPDVDVPRPDVEGPGTMGDQPGGHDSAPGSQVGDGDPVRRPDETNAPIPEREPALVGTGSGDGSSRIDAPGNGPVDNGPVDGGTGTGGDGDRGNGNGGSGDAPVTGGDGDLPRRPENPGEPHPALDSDERVALDRRQDDLADRNPADYDDWRLNDPAHPGREGRNQDVESRVALDLRDQGRLPQDVTRPADVEDGDFIDPNTGRKWDVKGFYSDWPDHVPPERRHGDFPQALTPEKFRESVARELELKPGERHGDRNVILNTRNLDQNTIIFMQRIIDEQGWGDRIVWYP